MLKSTAIAALVAIALTAPVAPALADSDITCTDVPAAQWKPADEIRKIAEGLGYEVRKVEAKQSCYEVYALDKDKREVEVYMDGATGKVVEVEG